jgi:adenylate kinase
MSVIFLAGVHGVGKGFLGAPVAKSLGINHFTASTLIREEKGHSTWGKDKHVTEINDNQLALIRAVSRHRESGQRILLDGHFVLFNQLGELEKIPIEVFSNLHLVGAITLTDEAMIVAKRLTERDSMMINLESIVELASEELLHARYVCSALSIPLIILNSPTELTLSNAVTTLLMHS